MAIHQKYLQTKNVGAEMYNRISDIQILARCLEYLYDENLSGFQFCFLNLENEINYCTADRCVSKNI